VNHEILNESLMYADCAGSESVSNRKFRERLNERCFSGAYREWSVASVCGRRLRVEERKAKSRTNQFKRTITQEECDPSRPTFTSISS